MNRIETLANGDVQLVVRLEDGQLQARRFRMHFGHVVEVQADEKVRRVGPELTFRGPSLVVKTSLIETILDAADAIELPVGQAATERTPAAIERAPIAERTPAIAERALDAAARALDAVH